VRRGEALVRRREYRQLVDHVFKEVAGAFKAMREEFTPVKTYVDEASTNEHVGAILDTHGDYNEVYDNVLSWIEQQPAFLRKAYEQVRESGTASEVNEMISRFKAETGTQAAPAVSAPAPAQPSVPAKAMQAAKRLSMVKTGRAQVVTSGEGDKSDFSAGFRDA